PQPSPHGGGGLGGLLWRRWRGGFAALDLEADGFVGDVEVQAGGERAEDGLLRRDHALGFLEGERNGRGQGDGLVLDLLDQVAGARDGDVRQEAVLLGDLDVPLGELARGDADVDGDGGDLDRGGLGAEREGDVHDRGLDLEALDGGEVRGGG